MKFNLEEQAGRQFPIRYIVYAISALLLNILQIALPDFVDIGGITPDLLIILCVWIALAEGQFIGLFAGFAIGLLFDVVSADVIGTNALAKLVAAFVAGWFYKKGQDDKIIGSYRFILIVLLSTFIHNLIYFFFYIKASELVFIEFFLKYGFASTLYTSVVSVIAMLIRIPKKEIDII